MNSIRNYNYYKDIVETKFIAESIVYLKNLENAYTLHKFIVQVLAVLMHPLYGDILPFPWRRNQSGNMNEFCECLGLFECVKQSILNCLLEIDSLNVFIKLYNFEDENTNLTRVSILRILLQGVRMTKEVVEKINQNKNLMSILIKSISIDEPAIAGTSLQILISILKHQITSKKDVNELSLPITVIMETYDKYISTHPYVSIIAINLLAELIQTESQISSPILARFQTLQSFTLLSELLNNQNKKINKVEEIRKIEGSCFGMPFSGFNDGIINFLQRMLYRYHKDKKQLADLFKLFQDSGIDQSIIHLLVNLGPKSDISPRGFVSLLIFIHDSIFSEFRTFALQIYQDRVLRCLCQLLKEAQLQAITEWPASYGGGPMCVNLITAQLIRIINLPFQIQGYEAELDRITKDLMACDIISSTIQSVKYLQKEHIIIALSLLSRLIINNEDDKQVAQNFVNHSGVQLIAKYNLLNFDNLPGLIIDSLNILSQLARISKDNYESIHLINIYQDLKRLIKHPESNIRSKVCNLIGNMCRHSSYFYDMLLKHDLINDCIQCCKDPDKNTKKFACFAVGNAGFHNDKLYEHLRPVVPLLVDLLSDQEEKTRANAAGALGNFVRNS